MAGLAKLVLITIVLLHASSAAVAASAYRPEFSAVMESEADGVVTWSSVNCAGDCRRLEINDPDTGEKAVFIIRLDKKIAWTLNPSMREYVEMPVESMKLNPLLKDADLISREHVGPDTIDDHPAVKELVTVDDDDGKPLSFYCWEASDIRCIIRAEALDGSWSFTFRDIKEGNQPATLFDVPSGYRETSGLPSMDDGEDETDEEYDVTASPYF